MMVPKIRKFLHKHISLILLSLVVINIGIIGYLGATFFMQPDVKPAIAQTEPEEITEIKVTQDMTARSQLYKKLIERVGPVQAQESLAHSGIPFDGQSHLLNHEVGEWLYSKYSTKGLAYCKDYFLSSCYHGYLIEFIADKGEDHLKDVMEECWKIGAPTATQCAHGIGHGLLAWNGYKNLPAALHDCDKVATQSPKFPTYNCYDGVFMENNWAVHEDGTPSPDRWYKADDPTYPCYDNAIDEKYRRACWSNQPQVMYKMFNGDISKVAKQCENIEATDYQETCFDSLARQINPVTQGNVDEVFKLCNVMPVGWKSKCVDSNVSAFFSVGDHQLPFTLCEIIPESGKKGCYEVLQQRISSYIPTLSERIAMCKRVPTVYLTPQCPSR